MSTWSVATFPLTDHRRLDVSVGTSGGLLTARITAATEAIALLAILQADGSYARTEPCWIAISLTVEDNHTLAVVDLSMAPSHQALVSAMTVEPARNNPFRRPR